MSQDSIIFFDGVCGLCSKVVDWIVDRDRRCEFKFSPLQGETASKLLPLELCVRLDTIVYYENGEIWITSDAVIMILKRLGGIYFVLGVLLSSFPKRWRDFGYKFISDRRYYWIQKNNACRMPRDGDKFRFLS